MVYFEALIVDSYGTKILVSTFPIFVTILSCTAMFSQSRSPLWKNSHEIRLTIEIILFASAYKIFTLFIFIRNCWKIDMHMK